MLTTTLKFQYQKIRENLITFWLIVVTGLAVLYVGYRHGSMLQATSYLFVMWLFSFLIDLYALKRPAKNDFPVREPKRETMYFFLCVCGAILFLFLRFSLDWQNLKPLLRLSVASLLVFLYPIVLAIIFLLLKYKPKDLGFRLQGLLLVVPVIAISFITNRIVSPENLTWDIVVAESGGVLGAILSGFILAGLSEEFFRVVGQTRLGALTRNFGTGWFITTIIWALMHAPKWYGESHDITEALLSSVRIIPIGLMWGYLTHRTKSILPSVIVHGTNVWGLQNF